MTASLLQFDFFAPAQVVGYIAMASGISAYALKNDRALKIVMGVCMALWSLHYVMLSAWTPAAVSLVVAARQVIATVFPHMSGRVLKHVTVAYMTIFTVILAMTWHGTASIWPWLAAVNATFAFLHLQGARMRGQLMGTSGLWIVNGLVTGSIGHIVQSTISLVVSGWTIVRMRQSSSARASSAPLEGGGMAAMRS